MKGEMGRTTAISTAFLALLSAGNGAATPAPGDPVTGVAVLDTAAGCTTNSLATPSWFIQDFKSSKAANSSSGISFRVLNRATNASSEVACGDSTSSTAWTRCTAKSNKSGKGELDVSIQITGSSAALLVNETWACTDKTPDKPILFTAVGNETLQLNCATSGGQECKSKADSALLIKGSLLRPVQITPVYIGGPPGHSSPNCTAPSKDLTWELSGTQYVRRSVQSKDGPTKYQSLVVQVTNDITGATASCSGTFTSDSGPQRMSCFAQGTTRPREKYHILTEASYDTATLIFTVNETWFCDNNDPAAPVTVQGSGTAKLSLECQDFEPEVDAAGATTITTFCSNTADTIPVPGSVVSQKALPAYALTDPLPPTDSCTVSSIVAPVWRISGFETISNATGSASDTILFGIELQTNDQSNSTDPSTFVSKTGVQLSSPTWFPCDLARGNFGSGPSNCTLRYDAASRLLSLNTEWSCSDLDAAHPITFVGVTNTTVPTLKCSTAGGITDCTLADEKPWAASITSVTWKSSA